MIDLWNVSLPLAIASLGLWLVVDYNYRKPSATMRKKLLGETRNAVVEAAKNKPSSISEETLDKIASLIEKSKLPKSSFEDARQLLLTSGLLFLVSLSFGLATGRIGMSSSSALEGITFLSGFVVFLFAIYNTYNLVKLLSSKVDPPSISISAGIIAGLVIGVDLFMIWSMLQIIEKGSAAIDIFVFTGLLFLSIVGMITLLYTRMRSKLAWAAYVLVISPWIFFVIVNLLYKFVLNA